MCRGEQAPAVSTAGSGWQGSHPQRPPLLILPILLCWCHHQMLQQDSGQICLSALNHEARQQYVLNGALLEDVIFLFILPSSSPPAPCGKPTVELSQWKLMGLCKCPFAAHMLSPLRQAVTMREVHLPLWMSKHIRVLEMLPTVSPPLLEEEQEAAENCQWGQTQTQSRGASGLHTDPRLLTEHSPTKPGRDFSSTWPLSRYCWVDTTRKLLAQA